MSKCRSLFIKRGIIILYKECFVTILIKITFFTLIFDIVTFFDYMNGLTTLTF